MLIFKKEAKSSKSPLLSNVTFNHRNANTMIEDYHTEKLTEIK